MFEESEEIKAAPKRATTPRQPPADKPLDGPITQAQLRKQLNLSFNAICRILKLPYVPEEVPGPEGVLAFPEDDFDAASTGFIVIVGEHGDLRRLVRLMGPLAGIMQLATVLDRIRLAFQLQQEQRKVEKQQKEWARQAAAQAARDAEQAADEAIMNGIKRPFGR